MKISEKATVDNKMTLRELGAFVERARSLGIDEQAPVGARVGFNGIVREISVDDSKIFPTSS